MTQTADKDTLFKLIADIKIAMLTTQDEDGTLHSRPMQNLQTEADGTLWFLTSNSASGTHEIQHDHAVNLAFSDPENHNYVSVSGTAQTLSDKAKINELWRDDYQTWFPGGRNDPALALLKVTIEKGEYWHAPTFKMMLLYDMTQPAGSAAADDSQHGKVELH